MGPRLRRRRRLNLAVRGQRERGGHDSMMLQTFTESDGAAVWRVGGYDHNSSRFLNRELSWLAFNGRVLALADDERIPPLDRLRFVSIFSGNLDEFYQVRVAGLSDQVEAGVTTQTADGRSPQEQIAAI